MATNTNSDPVEPPKQPLVLQSGPSNPTLTALSTLSLLNLRLSRLEYLLTGQSSPHELDADHRPSTIKGGSTITSTTNIPTQLRTLESRLLNLKRLDGLPGGLVRMVDSLRKEFPEFFLTTASTQTSLTNTSNPETLLPSKHDLSDHANEVLSHSTLYTSTSSRLQTLQTLRVPSASQSANLMNARPRLLLLKKRQEEIDAELAELRGRSTKVLEWWVKTGVVGMGELWEDWEGRVKGVEREVRRAERRKEGEG